MTLYAVTIGLVFAILASGIAVDRLYRRFARRHPQLGPFRADDGECGCCAARKACGGGSSCPPVRRVAPRPPEPTAIRCGLTAAREHKGT